jgi:MraZ protein
VVLSENLKRHARITETVAFVGLGHKFQIWEPGRFQNELAEATQKVRALMGELGSRSAARDAPGARE